MATQTITNKQPGARGFWHEGALVMVEPNTSVEVADMSDAEIKAAKATDYFEFGATAAKKAADAKD